MTKKTIPIKNNKVHKETQSCTNITAKYYCQGSVAQFVRNVGFFPSGFFFECTDLYFVGGIDLSTAGVDPGHEGTDPHHGHPQGPRGWEPTNPTVICSDWSSSWPSFSSSSHDQLSI